MRVLKFGGSSLSTPQKIKNIAHKLAEIHQSGEDLVCVVSAMGGTTDQLLNLAKEVSPDPSLRELDMLVSTGERISMALMCMALNDLGRPSISFTGSQAGIMTEGQHQEARIKEIKPIRLDRALEDKKLIVLAGFQGVDPTSNEITTLGRGGSDTTAVAMASHYGLGYCEMYKDVPGVFSEDPSSNTEAKIFDELDYDEMLRLCGKGAQVIHRMAVEMARDREVEIQVGLTESMQIGTRIRKRKN